MAKRKSARQIAAARRNIIKAQRASADSRRGKKRSKKSGHHYGTGKTGRRQARINKYGTRRNGISIAQATRRKQRSAKYKRAASLATTAALVTYSVYGDKPFKQGADYARKGAKSATVKYKNYGTNRKFKKMMNANGIKVGKVGK